MIGAPLALEELKRENVTTTRPAVGVPVKLLTAIQFLSGNKLVLGD